MGKEHAADAMPGPGSSAARPHPAVERWQPVRADMQEIFGTAAASASMPRRTPASPGPTRKAPAKARRLLVPLALLTVAAGAAAGLVVVAPIRHTPAATTHPLTARPAPVAASPMPVAMAVPAAVPSVSIPAAENHPSVETAQTVARNDRAGFDPAPAPATRAEGSGCGEGEGCSRRDVLAADEDLREAYLHAIDAGVDRGRLVSIRNRWARLRATEYDRPEALLAGYAELADRLDRAADDAGSPLR